MRYEDYLTAVERLRRAEAGESEFYIWPYQWPNRSTDCCTIYDFEHDPTPATVEWLVSIGYKQVNSAGIVFVKLSEAITAWDLAPGVMLTIHGLDVLTNPTCGDVLALLRVFSERKV